MKTILITRSTHTANNFRHDLRITPNKFKELFVVVNSYEKTLALGRNTFLHYVCLYDFQGIKDYGNIIERLDMMNVKRKAQYTFTNEYRAKCSHDPMDRNIDGNQNQYCTLCGKVTQTAGELYGDECDF